jgi:hypothetical protein
LIYENDTKANGERICVARSNRTLVSDFMSSAQLVESN